MNSVVGELRSELVLAVLIEKKREGKIDQQQAVDLIKNVQLILSSMTEKETTMSKEKTPPKTQTV
jgi:FtsZ-binding cell division protein ZapB